MRVFYANGPAIPLPEGHRFPASKYARMLRRVQQQGLFTDDELLAAPPASDEQLLRVHTAGYLHRMSAGEMSEKEMRRIGFPWSKELVERSCRSVGATIAACRAALQDGFSANLGGGTHHAYPDHGQGYCVFNDVAVATRTLLAEGLISRALIIDLDVHQGNGSAAIFATDRQVFTFSIHGQKNFPYHKERSDLDIALQDGVQDGVYLQAAAAGVEKSLELSNPDLVIYIAGADPYEDDQFGRMKVSMHGLAQRERLVFAACQHPGLPLALTMGGGYARQIEDTAIIHAQTLQIARHFFGEKYDHL